MHIQKTVLPSHIRVITAHVPSSGSVTVMVGVKAGSRYETKEISGISHFLEHMFFKGGKRYKNTREVSEVVDNIGGDFNAFTEKEYVGYYVKTAKEYMDVSFDVLSDMLCNAHFDEKEIEKERGVILEEINMYEDNPSYKVSEVSERLFYGDQPLGWDVAGTKENVKRFTRKDFLDFQKTHYTAENMVVVVAGDILHLDILEKVKKYFSCVPHTKEITHFLPYQDISNERVSIVHKPIEQAQIIMMFPSCSSSDNSKYAVRLLSIILGGNMSSRLFLKIREEKGLCYSIRAFHNGNLDVGSFECAAGIDVKRVYEALDAIMNEFLRVAQEGITENELKKAKAFIHGQTTMYLEDTENVATYFMKNLLLHNTHHSWKEAREFYEKVTSKEVHALAQKMFHKDKVKIAIVGPKDIKLSSL